MTHLAREKLMAFFSLLTTSHIKENAKLHSVNGARVFALSTRRNPTNIVAEHDPEVDLIGTYYRAGRGECGLNLVSVGGMDMS